MTHLQFAEMDLQEQLMADIKEAMKLRDQAKLLALRAVKAELLLLSTSGAEVTSESELKVLQKLVKQRKESADLYESQGRMDLVEAEIYQADIIAQYLPKQLSIQEIDNILQEVITNSGASGMADMGKVMGLASKEIAGRADGKTVSERVRTLLS